MTTIGNILFTGAAAPQGPWQDAGNAPAAGGLLDFITTILKDSEGQAPELPALSRAAEPAGLQEKLAALLKKQPAGQNADLTRLLEDLARQLSAQTKAEAQPAQILPLAEVPSSPQRPTAPAPGLQQAASILAALMAQAQTPAPAAATPAVATDATEAPEATPEAIEAFAPEFDAAETEAPEAVIPVTAEEAPPAAPQPVIAAAQAPEIVFAAKTQEAPETQETAKAPAAPQAETHTYTTSTQSPEEEAAGEAAAPAETETDTTETAEAALEKPAPRKIIVDAAPVIDETQEAPKESETAEAPKADTAPKQAATETKAEAKPETRTETKPATADTKAPAAGKPAKTAEGPALPERAAHVAEAVDVLHALIRELKAQDPETPPAPGLLKKIEASLKEIDAQEIIPAAAPLQARPAALLRDLTADMAPTLQAAENFIHESTEARETTKLPAEGIERRIAEILNTLEPAAAPETDTPESNGPEADAPMATAPTTEETPETAEAPKTQSVVTGEIIIAADETMEAPDDTPDVKTEIRTTVTAAPETETPEAPKPVAVSVAPQAEPAETAKAETPKIDAGLLGALREKMAQAPQEFTREDATAFLKQRGLGTEEIKTHLAALDLPPAEEQAAPAQPKALALDLPEIEEPLPQMQAPAEKLQATAKATTQDTAPQPAETRPHALPEQAKAAETPGQPAPAAAPAAFVATSKTHDPAPAQPQQEPAPARAQAPATAAIPAAAETAEPAQKQQPAQQQATLPQSQPAAQPQAQAQMPAATQAAAHAAAQSQPQQQQQPQATQPAAHPSHVNMLAAQENSAQTGTGSHDQSGAQLFSKTAASTSGGSQTDTGIAGIQSFSNYITAAQNGGAAPSPATQMVAVQLRSNAGSRIDAMTLQIVPAELGRLDIKLKFEKDGSIKAHLTAEKPETLNMLRQDSTHLHRALQSAGFETDDASLTFDLRQDNPQQQGANGTHDQNSRGNGGRSYGNSAAADAAALQAHIQIQAQGYISQTGVNIMV